MDIEENQNHHLMVYYSGDIERMRPYQDADWFRREYIDRERSTVSIGSECGVIPMRMYQDADWLKR